MTNSYTFLVAYIPDEGYTLLYDDLYIRNGLRDLKECWNSFEFSGEGRR